MKKKVSHTIYLTLDEGEKFLFDTPTGRIMADMVLAHTSDTEGIVYVSVSGRAIKADGTLGLFRRVGKTERQGLPDRLQSAFRVHYVERSF